MSPLPLPPLPFPPSLQICVDFLLLPAAAGFPSSPPQFAAAAATGRSLLVSLLLLLMRVCSLAGRASITQRVPFHTALRPSNSALSLAGGEIRPFTVFYVRHLGEVTSLLACAPAGETGETVFTPRASERGSRRRRARAWFFLSTGGAGLQRVTSGGRGASPTPGPA